MIAQLCEKIERPSRSFSITFEAIQNISTAIDIREQKSSVVNSSISLLILFRSPTLFSFRINECTSRNILTLSLSLL